MISLQTYINRLRGIKISQKGILNDVASLALKNIKNRHGVYPSDWHWDELSDYTKALKKAGNTPLLETGELRDSYGKEGQTAESVTVSSNNFKAIRMEEGVRTEKIPARPVALPESKKANKYMQEMFQKEIQNNLNKLLL